MLFRSPGWKSHPCQGRYRGSPKQRSLSLYLFHLPLPIATLRLLFPNLPQSDALIHSSGSLVVLSFQGKPYSFKTVAVSPRTLPHGRKVGHCFMDILAKLLDIRRIIRRPCGALLGRLPRPPYKPQIRRQIGRASCRERV